MAQGYKVPAAAAAVRMRVVRLEEVSNSRLVVVVHIVAVVHTAAAAVHTAAAAHTAEMVQVIGIHRRKDRETECSVACRVGAAQDMESFVVAGLAQQMRRRQPDVLREAYRG